MAPISAQNTAPGELHLPSWLRASAEARGRAEMESFRITKQDQSIFGALTRFRLNTQVSAATWLRFVVVVQDSRTLAGPSEALAPDNHLDILHGFTELGHGDEGPWRLRIGRQPLAFGDERLIGSDSFWCNNSQRFDSVRGTVRHGLWQVDLFTASPIDIIRDRVDPIRTSDLLSGIYGSWSKQASTVEPYMLWKRSRPRRMEPNLGDRYDLLTPGARVSLSVGYGFQAVTEVALQRGRVGAKPVTAWAGYWELSRRFGADESAPRVALSYSQASGDANGSDGRVGTFNDLNPAAYNGCGFFEPFSWRNIRDLRIATEWSLPAKWKLTAELHHYWLATVNDGVYVDEGPYVAYDPMAPSSRLGARALARVQRDFGAHLELGIGYARFFPSAYLKSGMSLHNSAFISWTMRT
ncbi:MAG: alginate export family protein [Bryobacteraceae bacterium]